MDEEFIKRHEAEHARVNRLKKAKGNVARDYWINMEIAMSKNNWDVGNVYKTPNIHDPHNEHVWADDGLPWWARALYGVAFLGFIAAIVIFGLLL